MNFETRFCSKCGSAVSLTAKFCGKCGRPFGPDGREEQDVAAKQDSPDAIEWNYSFPLLTNRFFLYDMAKMLFWTFAIFEGIMLSIFLIQREFENILPFLGIMGPILLGFIVAIAGITVVIFGNRFPTRFAVNPDGILYSSMSGRAGALNRAAIIIGLLARKPAAAGAGLIAASQESGGVSWKDVHRVREYPAQRVLSIRNSWRVVVRLYCSPENYARVLELVNLHAAAGALKRQELAREVSTKPAQWPRKAWLALLALAAFGAVLVCPFELSSTLLGIVLACILLTIWIPGISRVSGAAALAGIVFIILAVIRLGTEVHDLIPSSVLKGVPTPAWAQYTKYDSMDRPEWIGLCMAATGLICLAGLATMALLGKLHRHATAPRE